MLLLARGLNEEILIGDDIVIRVCRIKNAYQVTLGIDAPKHIRVWRREIAARIKLEQEDSKS